MISPKITVSGSARIGDRPIFGPLTLTLEGGRWTCLLGQSGVGKSTLLRIIAGLEVAPEFHGTVCVNGSLNLPKSVAYMAQQDLLLPWASVRHNILLGQRLGMPKPDLQHFEGVVKQTGLREHLSKKPNQLSGGQRQRVALARTLMLDRPVVLLDEPFSALDPQTKLEMQDLAVRVLRGKTVLMVTHDSLEAARLGDAIAIMTPTKIQEVPPPATTIPRGVADNATLSCQSQLLESLCN